METALKAEENATNQENEVAAEHYGAAHSAYSQAQIYASEGKKELADSWTTRGNKAMDKGHYAAEQRLRKPRSTATRGSRD